MTTSTKPSALALRIYEASCGMQPGALLADGSGAEGVWEPNGRHAEDAERVEAIDAEIRPLVEALRRIDATAGTCSHADYQRIVATIADAALARTEATPR